MLSRPLGAELTGSARVRESGATYILKASFVIFKNFIQGSGSAAVMILVQGLELLAPSFEKKFDLMLSLLDLGSPLEAVSAASEMISRRRCRARIHRSNIAALRDDCVTRSVWAWSALSPSRGPIFAGVGNFFRH